MAQQKEAISTINSLIETLKDGEKGFKEASEAVKDPQLKSLFAQYSEQRHRFASELQTEARSLGDSNPEKSSSAAGAMHRAWIDLKSAVTSGDEGTILSECERGRRFSRERIQGGDPGWIDRDRARNRFASVRRNQERARSSKAIARRSKKNLGEDVRGCASDCSGGLRPSGCLVSAMRHRRYSCGGENLHRSVFRLRHFWARRIATNSAAAGGNALSWLLLGRRWN